MNNKLEPEVLLPPPATEAAHRRVYITRALIEQFGGTDGCQGSLGGTGVLHNEACRPRMETEMKNNPDTAEKLRAAHKKRQDFVNKFGISHRESEEQDSGGGATLQS